jgi:hypothetical protein
MQDKETIMPMEIRSKIKEMSKYEFAQIANKKENKIKKNKEEKESKCCCLFYNRDSTDSRCCGICYCCCPAKTPEDQFNCCPNNFAEYWHSGYVQTYSGYGNSAQEENGICCWFCFPLKFTIFFPCFLGSLMNNSINSLRKTNNNYLF